MAEEIAGMIAGIIITLGITVGVVLSLYYYFKARNKERMAMIDKGVISNFEPPKRSPLRGLKFGLFIAGVGIGIFFGHILDTYTNIDEAASYFSMILLFGGLSFILSYFIELRKEKAEK